MKQGRVNDGADGAVWLHSFASLICQETARWIEISNACSIC